MTTRSKIGENERTAVKAMLGALEPFRAIRGDMPLQYVTAFLLVAEEDGLGVGDCAKRANVSVSVMSRHLLDIGERSRNMTPGFGLVTYRANPLELRKHEYMLTDRGRALLHQITRQLSRGGAVVETQVDSITEAIGGNNGSNHPSLRNRDSSIGSSV